MRDPNRIPTPRPEPPTIKSFVAGMAIIIGFFWVMVAIDYPLVAGGVLIIVFAMHQINHRIFGAIL